MKKEIIIIILIIIFIATLNFITEKYTKQSTEEIINILNELEEIVDTEEIEKNEVEEKIQELTNKWNEKNSKLEYYIEHDELEKINTQIFEIKGNIEEETYEEISPKIQNIIFILQHIEEKYKLLFKNIF